MLALALLSSLAFQCPDGSPPPCTRAAPRAPAGNSVAVLYFDNLSHDSADDYLADGLTEEIISRLGAVPRIAVKSRYEVRRVRGRDPGDPTALGRTLNAAWLLTGSVQRGGARVRVRVELVRAATRQRVWGDQFDQPVGDVLAIEDAIGRGVVQGIAGTLLPAERSLLQRRPTTNGAAYDLYLRGKVAFNRNDDSSAIELLTQAIHEDSLFAQAWASLALAWNEAADSWKDPREAYSEGRAAGMRALALDSGSAEARVALVQPALALDHDPPAGEALARQALARASNLPEAGIVLAFALEGEGRGSDAVASALRAWELDTLSVYTNTYAGLILMVSGRPSEIGPFVRRAAAGDVATVRAAYDTSLIADSSVLASLRAHWRVAGGWYGRSLVIALHRLGRDQEARLYLDSMLAARQQPGWFNPYSIAGAFAALGDRERALAWLQRTSDERTIWYLDLPFNHVFDAMRSDARFADMMRQFHVPVAPVN